MITTIGTVLVVISAALAWANVLAYHLSAPWWRSETGRHVMTFNAVLAIVLTLWAVGALTLNARGPWWDMLRLVAFTGVPLSLGWRLTLLYRLQIRRKERA